MNNSVEERIREIATALYLKYDPEEIPKGMGVFTPSLDLEKGIKQLLNLYEEGVLSGRLLELDSPKTFYLDESTSDEFKKGFRESQEQWANYQAIRITQLKAQTKSKEVYDG